MRSRSSSLPSIYRGPESGKQNQQVQNGGEQSTAASQGTSLQVMAVGEKTSRMIIDWKTSEKPLERCRSSWQGMHNWSATYLNRRARCRLRPGLMDPSGTRRPPLPLGLFSHFSWVLADAQASKSSLSLAAGPPMCCATTRATALAPATIPRGHAAKKASVASCSTRPSILSFSPLTTTTCCNRH